MTAQAQDIMHQPLIAGGTNNHHANNTVTTNTDRVALDRVTTQGPSATPLEAQAKSDNSTGLILVLRDSQGNVQQEFFMEPCTCRHLCLFISAVATVCLLFASLGIAIHGLVNIAHDTDPTSSPTLAPTPAPTLASTQDPALLSGFAQSIWDMLRGNNTHDTNIIPSISLNNS